MSKTITTPPQPYITSKLTFAAYLVAAGKSKLVSVKPTGNGRQVSFILSNPPDPDVVASFFSERAKVSALKYANTIATLKSLTYETHRAAE